MKKSFKLLSTLLLIISLFIFSGCNNQNKTMAKNIDNTITSLIYATCNLDWIDENHLITLENSLNAETQQNTTQNNEININRSALMQENADINTEHQLNNQYLNNKINNRKHFKPKPVRIINNNFRYNLPIAKRTMIQKNLQENKNTELSLKENSINNPIKNINQLKMVNYSTDFLTDSSNEVQSKINQLINKRSNILIYINDLYNSNIKLSQEDANAIIAYMNIIKECTSYLNSNKGIVDNQLSQANDLVSENNNSPLISAYLIRTNEAIETRLAKLDSASYAIDSILMILQTNKNMQNAFINNMNIYNNNLAENNYQQSYAEQKNNTKNNIVDENNNDKENVCDDCINKEDNCTECKNYNECECCDDKEYKDENLSNENYIKDKNQEDSANIAKEDFTDQYDTLNENFIKNEEDFEDSLIDIEK